MLINFADSVWLLKNVHTNFEYDDISRKFRIFVNTVCSNVIEICHSGKVISAYLLMLNCCIGASFNRVCIEDIFADGLVLTRCKPNCFWT